ncbi:RING finger protein [Trichinella pseudospiralis]
MILQKKEQPVILPVFLKLLFTLRIILGWVGNFFDSKCSEKSKYKHVFTFGFRIAMLKVLACRQADVGQEIACGLLHQRALQLFLEWHAAVVHVRLHCFGRPVGGISAVELTSPEYAG